MKRNMILNSIGLGCNIGSIIIIFESQKQKNDKKKVVLMILQAVLLLIETAVSVMQWKESELEKKEEK